jgi:hypothetical protein
MAKTSPDKSGHDERTETRWKGILTPISALNRAVRAVPAMKYALAVLGLVAVVAIIAAWRIDFRVAVFGAVIILVLMVAVLIFARLTKLAPQYFVAPAVFFMWTFVLVTAATGIALFTAATMKWPPALYELIFGKSSPPLQPVGSPQPRELTAQERNEVANLEAILQKLTQKIISREGITAAIRKYSQTRDPHDWTTVNGYLKAIDDQNNRLKNTTNASLGHFVVVRNDLYKNILELLDKKANLANDLRVLPPPHTNSQIAKLLQIAEEFDGLRPKLEAASSELDDYLRQQDSSGSASN